MCPVSSRFGIHSKFSLSLKGMSRLCYKTDGSSSDCKVESVKPFRRTGDRSGRQRVSGFCKHFNNNKNWNIVIAAVTSEKAATCPLSILKRLVKMEFIQGC